MAYWTYCNHTFRTQGAQCRRACLRSHAAVGRYSGAAALPAQPARPHRPIVLQSSANRELFHLPSVAEIRRRFAKRNEGEDRNRWLHSYNPMTVALA
jgi:hypothetical protein